MTLATPTGRLVSDDAPERPGWFAARRAGITGTDLPKILGESKYGNALSVWLDKRGELPDEPAGEAARWGQLLEDVVAKEWARRHGVEVVPVGVLAHVEHPWRRASLDRLVSGRSEGLEVKTRNAFTAGRWRTDMPDDVLAQVAWGRHVSGLDRIHVAVLLGGQELREFAYERDLELEEFLVAQAQAVWECIQAGVPPAVTPDGQGLLLGLLNRLYGHREGERDLSDLSQDVTSWLDVYASASANEAAARADKTRAKTALVEMLDDGEVGTVEGAPRFTYRRPSPGVTVSADALRRMQRQLPDVYALLREAEFITTTHPEPRFAVAKRAAIEEFA